MTRIFAHPDFKMRIALFLFLELEMSCLIHVLNRAIEDQGPSVSPCPAQGSLSSRDKKAAGTPSTYIYILHHSEEKRPASRVPLRKATSLSLPQATSPLSHWQEVGRTPVSEHCSVVGGILNTDNLRAE